jgi:hypothetical protein
MGSRAQWAEFVAGVRSDDEARAASFKEHVAGVLEALLSAVAGRQSAVWCLRDAMDADTVALQISKVPQEKAPASGYVCSLTGKHKMEARALRCVQVVPSSSLARKRGGYFVAQEATDLVEAVRAVAASADYVRTHADSVCAASGAWDEALCDDTRNALRLIQLATKAMQKT